MRFLFNTIISNQTTSSSAEINHITSNKKKHGTCLSLLFPEETSKFCAPSRTLDSVLDCSDSLACPRTSFLLDSSSSFSFLNLNIKMHKKSQYNVAYFQAKCNITCSLILQRTQDQIRLVENFILSLFPLDSLDNFNILSNY